ncbi:MAG: DUF262 domain-containing protein [Paludibacteraceae bacterium]|nr:DUF262 domain-containing protein [Paludibacteraceae bacterium]
MNKNSKFISGNEYCLRELLGGDTKMIIPDLQRDYCWGDRAYANPNDKNPRELVSDFVKNIVELFETDKNKRVTLGLIYGYEQPHNHIQICDGQQRLTTLFLLLGYINKCTNEKFKNNIISVKEMKDDYEPHLQYAIRESTLYFLSDLSRYVFVEKKTEIDKIKESDWYFDEYERDASIQSMIAALNTINHFFIGKTVDMNSLGNFVLDKLCVLYYDMESRSRGEETYVVINTTGEPLSATENIKPILLGKYTEDDSKTYSDQWEEREDWFWQNRGTDKTSDLGMLDFFTWYWQIGLIQESNWIGEKKQPLNVRDLFLCAPKNISENASEVKFSMENYTKFQSLDNLNKYFIALKTLVEEIVSNSELQKILLSIKNKKNITDLSTSVNVWNWLRNVNLDIVLPLIAFMAEHNNTSMLSVFVRRLRKNRYDDVWGKINNEQSRRGKNYMDWRYIVQIINQTTDDNLITVNVNDLKISKIHNVDISVWYNEDEIQKNNLRCQHISTEEMEDNELFMGDLTLLWSNVCQNNFISTVQKRWSVIQRICNAFDSEKAKNDIEFANWFRLYRLASGLVGLQHISNCCWTFEGCYYSSKPDTPWWIESKEIECLMEKEDLISYMRNFVKDRVRNIINRPSDYKELILCWMTLKTILADKGNYLVDYWSDRAISAFFELSDNYIFQVTDFHWGNVICGFSYSYTIYPARDESNWNIPKNLDSPLIPIKFIPDYYNRNRQDVDWDMIKKGDEEIKKIISCFLGDTIDNSVS